MIDSYDSTLDQHEHFVYDLAGNRQEMMLTQGTGSTATTQDTTYQYDANDRLLGETQITNGNTASEQVTTYGYDHTEQTSKEVEVGGVQTSLTTNAYDLQGQLAVVTTTTYTNGTPASVERTTNTYGADGILASELDETDANDDGTFETRSQVDYLNDAANMTGYSQAIRATTTDLTSGQVQRVVVTTFGHDAIAQTTTTYAGGVAQSPTTLVLGHDGHGSTRVLTDATGMITTVGGVRQVFSYDAYGNLLGMTAAQAATDLLYTGEMYDARIGQEYLRARWYDATTGRFGSLDSFFGDVQDPQSLHKYLYTADDPTNLIDSSGNDFSLGASLAGSTIAANLTSIQGGVYGYVQTIATSNVRSFQDFAYANVLLATSTLFPGIVAALDALQTAGAIVPEFLPFFDFIGFDVDSEGDYNSDATSGTGFSADATLSAAAVGRLGRTLKRISLANFPKPAQDFNLSALRANQLLGALYEALLAIKIYTDLGHTIPNGGWGHKPARNGLDVLSIDNQGRVYIWDAKGRSETSGVGKAPSKTFVGDANQAKVRAEALAIIDAENSLPQQLKAKARSNLINGRAVYRTAYAQVGKPGFRLIKNK